MILQERDIEALSLLARYFVLTSRQLREMCFTSDSTGRVTRRRLTGMRQAGYLRKRNLQVVNPRDGVASPVYHLTKQGLELLAGHFDDETLLRKPVEPSQPQHLQHYVAVAYTHHMMRKAIAANSEVKLDRWVNEDEPINLESEERKTFLRKKFGNISFLPDAGYVLEFQNFKAVFYLEQDRDTYFYDRVAARKSPGYRKMWETKSHLMQFPDSSLEFFFVLFVAPNKQRRDQLRKAFAKKNKGHDILKAFRFVAFDEVTPENLLFESILTRCQDDELVPMVKRVTPQTTETQSPLLRSGSE